MSDKERLMDNIHSEFSISCSSCRKIGIERDTDDWYAAEALHAKGWRATNHGNIYCPDCAKKKLKQPK